jgi:hypothetical protein
MDARKLLADSTPAPVKRFYVRIPVKVKNDFDHLVPDGLVQDDIIGKLIAEFVENMSKPN